MDEANGLLPDDKLTIFCEVRSVMPGKHQTSNQWCFSVATLYTNLFNNLIHLGLSSNKNASWKCSIILVFL